MTTTRGGADATNLYTTPDWAVDAVLPHIPLAGVIVDAGCGEGAILSRIASYVDRALLLGVEIEEERAARAHDRMMRAVGSRPIGWSIHRHDWLTWSRDDVNTVVMNPPFSLAEEFLERALAMVAKTRGTVAALLRYNWNVPACRADFCKRHGFDVGWLTRRPEFVASLKCAGVKGKDKCGWATMQPVEAERPKACPGCGKGVSVTTNDSADCGWFLLGPGRGGRFFPLDVPERVRVPRAAKGDAAPEAAP